MRLICLGDSLTEGYDISESFRWTNLLMDDLNIEIINAGISGDTTAGMLARCERLLIDHEPSHLIVLGGINDLWFGLKDEYILSNLHAITRQTRYYNVQFIIGIPTPAFNLIELNSIQENYSECVRSFRTTLINYCKSEEVPYIDFSQNITSDHMLADGIHPNKKGHEHMKNTILDFMTKNQ